MKTCPHCSLSLSPQRFYKNAARPDGLSILCRGCHRVYEGGTERRVKRTWNTIRARVLRQSSYAGVEVRMTRDKFISWAIQAYTAFQLANPNDQPSLDRIDPTGHYELGNLRVLSRGDNARLASNHPNVHAPSGMAWCCGCKAYLPESAFWREASAYNGLQGRCKPCTNKAIAASKLKASRSSPSHAP
jgi:hypothetical protein